MLYHFFQKLRYKFQVCRHRRCVFSAIKGGLTLGENVTIMNGVRFDPPHNALISIGNNCTIAPDVMFIAHDASTFKPLNISRIGEIVIGQNCFIGARSVILPGVTIGSDVVVGAGTVVAKDIPFDSVVVGNPAKIIGCYQDFLHRRNRLVESSHVVEYRKFYEDVKGSIVEMSETGKSRNLFFIQGQTSNLRSAFRFNVKE